MRLETIQAYRADCLRYGWPPSLRGLNAYDYLTRAGFRTRWTSKGKGGVNRENKRN